MAHSQRGVGLIEVLVAVLILSLGMLGMAGLQANALKANQSSYARTQAVMLSYYMLDAMRVDKRRALKIGSNTVFQYNTFNSAGTAIEYKCDPGNIDPVTGAYDRTTGDFPVDPTSTDPTLLVNNTRFHWLASAQDTQIMGDIEGTTCVWIECKNDKTCTVRLKWDDSRATGGLVDQSIETTSLLD